MKVETFVYIAYAVIVVYLLGKLIVPMIEEFLMTKTVKKLESNPKWLMEDIKNNYYGFEDIDIIIAHNKTGLKFTLPHLRMSNDEKFEFWVPEDVTSRDAEEVAKLALMGKIQIKHNINAMKYLDKPLYWLCILCYMLDGGDIRVGDTAWEKR